MKNLKFDHQLADLIRRGKKTATWRIYDDKNISVNDEVELIDKVDVDNPASWVVFGTARVDMVIEKRIGSLRPADYEGHEKYHSIADMLKTFQSYYGPQVTLDTPIKMIHFTVNNNTAPPKVVTKSTKIHDVKLYADGGSRGNPGPSASGFVILTPEDEIVVKKGTYLGVTTNNQAEYQALRAGLQEAQKIGVRTVHVYMDSMLVINQMLGIFQVKNRDLWPIHDAIKQLVAQFKHVTFTHVPRALNKLADAEVNKALDEALSRNKH